MIKECARCGEAFETKHANRKYCVKCRHEALLEQKREQNRRYREGATNFRTTYDKICERCGEPYVAGTPTRKYCTACQKIIRAERQHERYHRTKKLKGFRRERLRSGMFDRNDREIRNGDLVIFDGDADRYVISIRDGEFYLDEYPLENYRDELLEIVGRI